MRTKNKSIYLNYVKDIETKVTDIYAKLKSVFIINTQKQSIEKQRDDIFAKTSLLTLRANQDALIPNAEWIAFKKEIDDLYKNFCDTVNQSIEYSKRATVHNR